MLDRDTIVAVALMALSFTMSGALSGALAHDESKYPDWSGQWLRMPDGGPPRYDTTKPIRKQEAPLTPEYQALYQASLNVHLMPAKKNQPAPDLRYFKQAGK